METEVERLTRLLREAYRRVPESRCGKTVCTEFDPAGSTYEFTEAPWSKEARDILGIITEPNGF